MINGTEVIISANCEIPKDKVISLGLGPAILKLKKNIGGFMEEL